MRCPVCGATTQAQQRFCMDCGTALAGAGTGAQTRVLGPTGQAGFAQPTSSTAGTHASTDPTTMVPVITGSATLTGVSPAASTTAAAGADPTMQIRIVEQTSSGPAVDWANTAGTGVPAQLWTPAPTLAPQPITAGSAPFIEDAWHTAPDDGWRGSAAPLDPEPFDAAVLTIFILLATALGLTAMFTKLVSFDFGDGKGNSFKIETISSNAIPTMIAIALALLVGGGLAIGRQRIGAGLAAGAGLALAGVVAVDLAIAQQRIQALKLFVTDGQTLSIRREIPYFVLIAAGVCGLVVFLAALPAARGDGRPRLNAVLCWIGALAVLAVAVGPFLPGKGSTWGTNTAGDVFPSFVPWLRIGAMALVAVAGIVGFANRRRWGVGVALGGLVAVVVQWVGTLSSTRPAGRTGVGIASIGTANGTPHVVITIGLIAAALIGLTAILLDMGARRAR